MLLAAARTCAGATRRRSRCSWASAAPPASRPSRRAARGRCRARSAPGRRCSLIGVSPLVLGSLFDTRFDLWPTLLAVGALAALVYERPVLRGGLLGLGFAAKLWPAVLAPDRGRPPLAAARRRSAAVHRRGVRRRRGRVLPALRDPRAARAPRRCFADQFDRPLQVESLGAAVLMAARAPRDGAARRRSTRTARRRSAVAAPGSPRISRRSVEIVAVIGRSGSCSRAGATPTPEALLIAAAATVAALVAFDKVLSPQYLIWLVPFVALACGRARHRRRRASSSSRSA